MRTRTAKGFHRYYRYPDVPVGNKVRIKTDDPRVRLDVRGDGGYVVAPGSIHPSGVAYEVLGEWPDSTDSLPRFDPAWVASDPPPAPPSPDTQSVRRGCALVWAWWAWPRPRTRYRGNTDGTVAK